MEGLSGAIDCFKYKFVDEGSGDAGAEGKNKKAKTAKGAVAAGDAASGEDRDEKMRKKGRESGEGAEAEDGSEAFQKKAKKPPPPVTGYKLYSKAVIAEVKKENPEAGTQDVIKIIKKMYGELDEDKKQVCVCARARACVHACVCVHLCSWAVFSVSPMERHWRGRGCWGLRCACVGTCSRSLCWLVFLGREYTVAPFASAWLPAS